ncbi:nitroreductase [Gordoniibacillus kamchatkensis]|uniref:Putative NAD(P)H nitroreductase n=1 Tax=Gordoniibacillus kamchatkensis TaxID=1590651 RepID=A0ABR5ADG6_9BACL|nr:nitroreductase [Paenibacillus sp. VKM B-2647]KIL39084.1 nitroreductase [Paenibacillus sp. VKM B-2647]
MDAIEAIRTRRSVGKVKPDPVERELIEQMLESAIWAPNHYHTEPWRFFVMTGEGRRVLARIYADIAAERAEGLDAEQLAQLRSKEEQKAFRAPVIIAVAVSPAPDKPEVEEAAAVNAAIQNMLLTAHALGLGAIWRTGEAAYRELAKQAFGLRPEDRIAGFVFAGYPDMAIKPGKRTPFEQKTQWITEA